ncbi:hypothetical protein FOZ70_11845 [Burkholderia sp. COPS]|nr:hypothetical protein [Burkholderia sp. COPS]
MTVLNEIIVPAKSLGGIILGEKFQVAVDRLGAHHVITRIDRGAVAIDDGAITIYYDPESGCIESLACNKNFRANFLGKLWPGMTVGDVLERTKTQLAWCGFVQVDGIGGVGLSLPEEFDDFEQLTDFLGREFVFNELWVYRF